MRLKEITRCISVALVMCSAQAYAAPMDSDPTAVNFSGNVTSSTCAITGPTANQIIELGDLTINDLNNMTGTASDPSNPVDSTIGLSGCNSSAPVKLTFGGTSGVVAASYEQTGGSGSGVDFIIQTSYVNGTTGVPPVADNFYQSTPGTPANAIDTDAGSSPAVPSMVYQIPIRVGLIRDAGAIQSGAVTMMAPITITYS